MTVKPALRGRSSVLSWDPPSGKIPIQSPLFKTSKTASYTSDWSTLGITL